MKNGFTVEQVLVWSSVDIYKFTDSWNFLAGSVHDNEQNPGAGTSISATLHGGGKSCNKLELVILNASLLLFYTTFIIWEENHSLNANVFLRSLPIDNVRMSDCSVFEYFSSPTYCKFDVECNLNSKISQSLRNLDFFWKNWWAFWKKTWTFS